MYGALTVLYVVDWPRALPYHPRAAKDFPPRPPLLGSARVPLGALADDQPSLQTGGPRGLNALHRQPVFAVVPHRLLPTSLGRIQALQEVHLPALRSVWRCPALKLFRRLHPMLHQYAPGLCTQTESIVLYAITLFGRLRRKSTIIRVALFYLINGSILY